MSSDLDQARGGDESAFARLVAPHRDELRAHCYRMSGTVHDAEDLLQETLVRSWRGLGAFEGRSSLRTWLYRVATNACLDALKSRARRGLPMDFSPAGSPEQIGPPRLEPVWVEPCPGTWVLAAATPDARYDARESVALAFLTAIQRLPPRQRAVLLLRDVIGFAASECAEQLDSTVASVNSALQRARETLSTTRHREPGPVDDEGTKDLLARYLAAWEATDVNALVSLLRHDAVLAMPPLPVWLVGPDAIAASIGGMLFVPEARGNVRMLATQANGRPAFAMYQRQGDGPFSPVSIHLPYCEGEAITHLIAFLDPSLFAALGLPATLA